MKRSHRHRTAANLAEEFGSISIEPETVQQHLYYNGSKT